jgi:ADP-ribosylglycohydrolase
VLWSFYSTDSFENALIEAVNLGDDADTVGATTGQIAGVYYGFENIPKKWIDNVADKNLINTMATKINKARK